MRPRGALLAVVFAGLLAGAPTASAQVLPLPPIIPPPDDPSPPPPGQGGPATPPPPPPATTPGVVSTAPGTFGVGVNPARTGHVADDALVPPLVKRWEFAGKPDSMLAADGRLFLSDNERRVAVDLATGKQLWSVPIGGFQAPSYDAGRLIVRREKELFALDAATGSQLWRADLSAEGGGDPVAAGGQVYVMSGIDLFAFDAANGTQPWKSEVAGFRGPAVDDSRLYVLGVCGEGRAVARSNGAEVWRRLADRCQDNIQAMPVLANGRLYHAAGWVLDPATGAEIARNAGEGEIFFDNRVVMRPTINLRAADSATWAPAWTHKRRLDAPIAAGHDVYGLDWVSSGTAPNLLALDGDTGAVIWSARMPGKPLFGSQETGGGWRTAAAAGVLVVSASGTVSAWESYFKPDAAGIAFGYDRTEFTAGKRVHVAGVLGTNLRGPRPPVTVERAGWRRGAFRALTKFPVAIDGGFGASATLTRNARLRVSAGGAKSNVINVYAWPSVRLGKARAAGRTRITLGATVRSPGAPLGGRSFSIYLDRRGAKRLTRIATGRLRAAGRGGRFRATLTFRPLRKVKKSDGILFCIRGQLDLDLGRPSRLLRQCGAGSVRRG